MNMKRFTSILASSAVTIIFGVTSYTLLLLSQLSRSYLFTLSSLFFFYLFASYVAIIYKRSHYFLVLAITFPLSIRTIMLLFLTNEWFLANGDLIYMMKISEKTITKSHYPFGEKEILSIRPNYLEYPASFLLQSILSLILNINIDTLTLYSPAAWAAYILILLVALGFVTEVQRNAAFESYLAVYIMGLIIFNFLAISFSMYFIYSNITRALIILYVYMLAKYIASTKSRSKYTIITLLLLSTSIVLGHSQEPTMLFLYLFLLASVLIIVKILRWGNASDNTFREIVQSVILFIVLYLLINIFIAIITYSSAITFIYRLISNLIGKINLEFLAEKEEIAAQVLTWYELFILRITLVLNGLLIFGILIRCLKENFRKRNMFAFSVVIASSTFLIINGMIVFYQGILSDLIFRPLWVFLCSLLPIFIFEKNTIAFANQNLRKVNTFSKKMIKLSLIIALSLFAVSNMIYSRYHILTSEVYLHESLTVRILGAFKKVILDSDFMNSQVLIVDTPEYPSYEIQKVLILLTNKTYKMVIYLDPEIPNYRYSYLNGVLKSRGSLGRTCVITATVLQSCNSLEFEKLFNTDDKIYIIGQIKHPLQQHSSIILSVNEYLGLGILRK